MLVLYCFAVEVFKALLYPDPHHLVFVLCLLTRMFLSPIRSILWMYLFLSVSQVYEFDEQVQYRGWFLLFCLFWTLNFITAMGQVN